MKSAIEKEKLLAFALGELQGSEAAEVEACLAGNAEAKKFVDEARALAHFAAKDFAGEPLPQGKGSAPIFKKIFQLEKSRPSEKQRLLQAAAISAVIVLFFVAFPLRKKFDGSVAQIIGGRNSATEITTGILSEDESMPRRTQRKVEENPHLIETDFSMLDARGTVRQSSENCRFSVPAAAPGDRFPVEGSKGPWNGHYLLAQSGAEFVVTVGSTLPPLLLELGVEEIAKDKLATLYRRRMAGEELVYYRVVDDKQSPVCFVQLELEGYFSTDAKKFIGAPMEALGEKIAESLELTTGK